MPKYIIEESYVSSRQFIIETATEAEAIKLIEDGNEEGDNIEMEFDWTADDFNTVKSLGTEDGETEISNEEFFASPEYQAIKEKRNTEGK